MCRDGPFRASLLLQRARRSASCRVPAPPLAHGIISMGLASVTRLCISRTTSADAPVTSPWAFVKLEGGASSARTRRASSAPAVETGAGSKTARTRAWAFFPAKSSRLFVRRGRRGLLVDLRGRGGSQRERPVSGVGYVLGDLRQEALACGQLIALRTLRGRWRVGFPQQ